MNLIFFFHLNYLMMNHPMQMIINTTEFDFLRKRFFLFIYLF